MTTRPERGGSTVVLGLGAACGLLLGSLGMLLLLEPPWDRVKGSAEVVVALEELVPGVPITPGQVALVRVELPHMVEEDVFWAVGAVVDRLPRTTVLAGEPVRARRLVGGDQEEGIASLVSPGMRAVTLSLPVDAAGGGSLASEDRVDAVLRLPIIDRSGRVVEVEQHTLEGLRVLLAPPRDRPDPDEVRRGKRLDVAWALPVAVTVEAMPADAVRLALASAEGEVVLVVLARDEPAP